MAEKVSREWLLFEPYGQYYTSRAPARTGRTVTQHVVRGVPRVAMWVPYRGIQDLVYEVQGQYMGPRLLTGPVQCSPESIIILFSGFHHFSAKRVISWKTAKTGNLVVFGHFLAKPVETRAQNTQISRVK